MDKHTFADMFAKAKLLGLNDGEIHFIEYKLGIAGSFYQGLFDLYYKADIDNKRVLESAFREEFDALKRWEEDINYYTSKLGVHIS